MKEPQLDKEDEIPAYKKVCIPHLCINVYFKDLSELQGIEKKGSGYTCLFGENSICVFIENIKTSVKKPECFPTIAHEVMHVIQILCEKFSMRVENEQEHTAYLTHYLLHEILQ